ncbi:MAG: hypothetical protein RL095_3856 [Verrucomicrobiota bacterium]|jgi:hypothetical protein
MSRIAVIPAVTPVGMADRSHCKGRGAHLMRNAQMDLAGGGYLRPWPGQNLRNRWYAR